MSNTISRLNPGLQAAQPRVNKGEAPKTEPVMSGKVVSGEGSSAPSPKATGDPSAAVTATSNAASSHLTAYSKTAQESAKSADEQREAFAEYLAKAVEEVAIANDRSGIRVKTDVHEETGRYIVQVIESETGEVLREFPPLEYLEVVAALDELEGLFLREEM